MNGERIKIILSINSASSILMSVISSSFLF